MRNLKKILALVLALVMSLSLMATAGAADFTDASDINEKYETAIEVLEGLGVFKGYQDGTFQPTGSITRAETAAIIYRIVTGDVKDEQVGIYADYNLFSDVPSTSWFAGYVNYCANAEYIKGDGKGKFSPNEKVEGYAALAMILRAIGYTANGGFTGSDWRVQTARVGEARKITKNILTGTLGQPATRETVAEILFQAILVNMVDHNVDNTFNGDQGYFEKDITLGYKTFGLEELVGVVMANEYASLTSASTARDGKTELLVDDKTYTMDYVTNLDDIGESRLAYVQNGSKVLSLADSGLNTTEESTDRERVADVLSRAGIRDDNAEQFLNFDVVMTHDSAYRLKYVVVCADNAAAVSVQTAINTASGLTGRPNDIGYANISNNGTGNAVTRIITPRATITATDLWYMEYIFGMADWIIDNDGNRIIRGEVYVGTQSNDDISDGTAYSYERFYDEFIDEHEGTDISANENGNWVKVIDNDADGVADYIFKVVYTMAQVSRVNDDVVTLDTKDHILIFWNDGSTCGADGMNNLTTQPVVPAEDLVAGDVVYYAVIDGKAQTYKSEVVSAATIERVDHNALTATTTDEVTYNQSGVHEHIEDEAYEAWVRNLAGKVSYDLFLDRGGHLAAFVKTDKTGEFKLITDGWYNRLKENHEYAVKAYNDETGAQDIVDITANGGLFVFNSSSNGPTVIQNNNWGALKWFGGDNTGSTGALNGDSLPLPNDKVHTTVVSIAADGTILPVENSSVTGRYQRNILDINSTTAVPTKTPVDGTIYSTTTGANTAYNLLGDPDVDNTRDNNGVLVNNTFQVRALDTTVYYVVYPVAPGSSTYSVIRTVGYANAPDLTDAAYGGGSYVEDIYAVGTLHEADNNLGQARYYTADVVVVELTQYDGAGELVFVVDDTARFTDVRHRDVHIINSKGEEETVTIDVTGSGYVDGKDNSKQILPGFYRLLGDKSGLCTFQVLDAGTINARQRLNAEDIRKTGVISVGQVKYHDWFANNKYVVTDDWTQATVTAYNNTWANGRWNWVNIAGNTTSEGRYSLSDDTPLYTLAYNSRTTGRNVTELGNYQASNPTLTKVDHTIALEGTKNETRDRSLIRDDTNGKVINQNLTFFNYNDVLVFHNGKGAAVYAVSFANILRDGDTYNLDYFDDYAQAVWQSIIPNGAPTVATTVTFYGVTDNKTTSPADQDSTLGTIDVLFATAKAGTGLTVSNATNVVLVKADGTRVSGTTSGSTTTFTLPADGMGASYTLYLTDKDGANRQYNLIQQGGRNDNGLFYTKDDGTEGTAPTNVSFVWGEQNKAIQDIEKLFYPKNGAEITKWDWRYVADNTVVSDKSITTYDGVKAAITVRAENGFEKTYMLYFDISAVPKPADVIAKITNKYGPDGNGYNLKLYFNGDNFYLSEAEAVADSAAAGKSSWTSAERATIELAQAEIEGTGYEVWKAGYIQYSVGSDGRPDDGFGATTDYGYTTTLGVDGSEKYVGYQLFIKHQQTMEEYDSTTPITAPLMKVRIVQVDRAARNTAVAAQNAVTALGNMEVYYSEWHASNRDSSGNLTSGYDGTKAGSAEYVNENEALAIVQPNGQTSFGRDASSGYVGEMAMVAKVNAALKNAGVNAVIKATAHDGSGTVNTANWGTDGTAPNNDVYGDPDKNIHDTAVYTNWKYELFSADGTTDLGVTVTISYTVKAVIVSWEGNASYPQYIPSWVLNP